LTDNADICIDATKETSAKLKKSLSYTQKKPNKFAVGQNVSLRHRPKARSAFKQKMQNLP